MLTVKDDFQQLCGLWPTKVDSVLGHLVPDQPLALCWIFSQQCITLLVLHAQEMIGAASALFKRKGPLLLETM